MQSKFSPRLLAALTMVAVAVLFCGGILAAQAQPYPSRAIRIVVGAGAGGPTDLAARVVSLKLSELWGVPVVVENRGGASGTIGADGVAKSAPDGYTVFAGSFAPSVIAGTRTKVPYDAYKDFAHVSVLGTYPMAIVVPTNSRFKNLQQIIDESRSKPGSLNYGSGGVGASSHLFVEMMNMMAKAKAVNVPFQGGGPALNALLGEQLDFAALGVTIIHAQGERIRALAVTSAKPNFKVPDVPPIAGLLPGYDAQDFVSLHMPLGTPPEIVNKMQQAMVTILQQPEVKERFDQLAMEVRGSTPAEAATFIHDEIEKWRPVIKATGLDLN
jgi:tripartite-type tricarboxylate transporter receptor subunit TctC